MRRAEDGCLGHGTVSIWRCLLAAVFIYGASRSRLLPTSTMPGSNMAGVWLKAVCWKWFMRRNAALDTLAIRGSRWTAASRLRPLLATDAVPRLSGVDPAANAAGAGLSRAAPKARQGASDPLP